MKTECTCVYMYNFCSCSKNINLNITHIFITLNVYMPQYQGWWSLLGHTDMFLCSNFQIYILSLYLFLHFRSMYLLPTIHCYLLVLQRLQFTYPRWNLQLALSDYKMLFFLYFRQWLIILSFTQSSKSITWESS